MGRSVGSEFVHFCILPLADPFFVQFCILPLADPFANPMRLTWTAIKAMAFCSCSLLSVLSCHFTPNLVWKWFTFSNSLWPQRHLQRGRHHHNHVHPKYQPCWERSWGGIAQVKSRRHLFVVAGAVKKMSLHYHGISHTKQGLYKEFSPSNVARDDFMI